MQTRKTNLKSISQKYKSLLKFIRNKNGNNIKDITKERQEVRNNVTCNDTRIKRVIEDYYLLDLLIKGTGSNYVIELLEEIAKAGESIAIGGRQGTGKTLLLASIARCLSRGNSAVAISAECLCDAKNCNAILDKNYNTLVVDDLCFEEQFDRLVELHKVFGSILCSFGWESIEHFVDKIKNSSKNHLASANPIEAASDICKFIVIMGFAADRTHIVEAVYCLSDYVGTNIPRYKITPLLEYVDGEYKTNEFYDQLMSKLQNS